MTYLVSSFAVVPYILKELCAFKQSQAGIVSRFFTICSVFFFFFYFLIDSLVHSFIELLSIYARLNSKHSGV